MFRDIKCKCKILNSVDIFTSKSSHYKNEQMDSCTLENVANFLQYSELRQPQVTQATYDNSD